MIDVDIILICYNQERYIKEAIDSIFSQRVDGDVRLHLIVADDCSADNTLKIIRNSVESFHHKCGLHCDVKYLPSTCNVGISRNYQRALATCSGDFIAIMEGDDIWTSSRHLQQHLDFLLSHPWCSMSMNSIEDTHGEEYYLVDWRQQITDGNQLGNLSACVLKTECVQKLPEKVFSVHFDDYVLGIFLSQQGPIGILKESTSVYRRNEQSMWASLSQRKMYKRNLEFVKIYDKLQDYEFHSYWNECVKKLKRQEKIRLKHLLCHNLHKIFPNLDD